MLGAWRRIFANAASSIQFEQLVHFWKAYAKGSERELFEQLLVLGHKSPIVGDDSC